MTVLQWPRLDRQERRAGQGGEGLFPNLGNRTAARPQLQSYGTSILPLLKSSRSTCRRLAVQQRDRQRACP